MLDGIIHKIRNGLDDIGSFVTGQPAHGPAPQVQQQQFSPGKPLVSQPPAFHPAIQQQFSQNQPLHPNFVNPQANKFASDLAAGQFKQPSIQVTPQPVAPHLPQQDTQTTGAFSHSQFTPQSFAHLNPSAQPGRFQAYQPTTKPVPANETPNAVGEGLVHTVITPFARALPEIAASVTNHPITLPHQHNPVMSTIFGSDEVKPVQQDVAGVYKANEQRGPLAAGALAAGDVVAHAAQDIPVAGEAVDALKPIARISMDAARSASPEAVQALHGVLQKLPDPIRSVVTRSAATDKPVTMMPAKNLVLSDREGYGEIDPSRVDFYKQQIAQGKPLEPVIAVRDSDGNLYLEDGKHRVFAARQMGIQNVPVRIIAPEDISRVASGAAHEPAPESPGNAAIDTTKATSAPSTENPDESPNRQSGAESLQPSPETPAQLLEQKTPPVNQISPEVPIEGLQPDDELLQSLLNNTTTPQSKGIRLATNDKESPDVQTFVSRSEQRTPYTSDLEANIKKLKGHFTANRIALKSILKGNKNLNPADLEQVYHHAEDPTVPLSPRQQEIFDKYYTPLREAQSKASEELTGEKSSGDNYMHRIAKDKGSNLDAFMQGRRQSPEEGVNRKTVDSSKGRHMMAITDEGGNRTVVSIASPKDELGKASGPKRVTAFDKGQKFDMGAFKTKTNQELLDRELKPQQEKLKDIARQVKALQSVRSKGGVSEARLSNLAQRAGELQYIKDEGKTLTPQEARSLRDATTKFKELSRVKPTGTNVDSRLQSLGQAASDLLNKTNEITQKYDPDQLQGKVFVDKFGNKYKVSNATTKEIEDNTGVKYYHEPLLNTALNIVNTRNAVAAKEFMEHWQQSPDFAEHAIKADAGHIPDNWKAVNSPAFRGYYFDPETAKLLETHFGMSDHADNAIVKAWDGATNIATQAIVINPEVHGVNLYTQGFIQSGNIPLGGRTFLKNLPGGPVGMLRFNRSLARMKNATYRAASLDDYLRNGGHFMTYGKDQETMVSKALQKMNLPGVNKLNADAMSGIDATIRASLWDAAKDSGMPPEQIISDIDRFLGRQGNDGEFLHGVTMFYHWLKTQSTALGSQVTHPIKNIGANVNTLLFTAILYGANTAWQKFTGNKYAHVRIPGELSLAHDLYTAPSEIAHGQVPGVVTSHINPLINAGMNQAFGEDLFSKKQLNTPKDRLNELAQNLVAPLQNASKISDGKSTVPEQMANEFGFYTPHIKGTAAAPNFGGVMGRNFNTNGATNDTNTAYAQVQQYYKSLDSLKSSLAGDQRATDAAMSFIQKDKTPDGQTIELAPGETEANWKQLATNGKALAAVQQFYKNSTSHNPEWDLSGYGVVNGQQVAKMAIWAAYKSLPPGDVQKDAIASSNSWIRPMETKVNDWASKQKFGNIVQEPGYIKYPQVPNDVQNLMTLSQQLSAIPAANRTQDQMNQLKAIENNPAVQEWYNKLDAYTNAVRKQMNMPEVQYAPDVPKAVQDFENQYMSNPASRNALRTQYPQLYAQMQQALEQQSLASANKYGGEAYYGAPVPDSYLSDIYSLGNYDITKEPNANGTNTYALNNFTGSGAAPNGLPSVSGAGIASASGGKSTKSEMASIARRLRAAKPRNIYMPKKPHPRSTEVHTKHIASKITNIKPQGHYTGTSESKGNKVKNIRVAGVKTYKPTA